MNRQKSFLTYVAEMIEQYRADRQCNSSQNTSSQPGRLRRLVRWLTPNGGTLILIALLIATQGVWARPLLSPANAPGPSATTVNYQGRLADHSGNPLDGTYGMTFALWDAAAGGNLVWGPESHATVPVSQGLFSVGLGSQTPGGIPTSAWNGDRYLEITVGGETLNPRELIRSVPIAGMALTVPDGAIGTAQIADGAVSTTDLAINAVTSGQIADNAFSTSRIADGAVTQAKAPYLAAAPWNNRLVVVTTWVGHTNSSGIATVDISSYGFSGIDSVVVSNGDDYAVARGVFNVYDWNTAQVQVRCWNINGTLLANTLLRVNLAIMGTH